MDELEAFQDLVHNVLLMHLLENSGTLFLVDCEKKPYNDCVQISFHEIEDHVEILIVLGLDDVEQPHDVLMAIQFLQEHDLPESTLGVSGVMERIEHLLQRNHLLTP